MTRDHLMTIFGAALAAADPSVAVASRLSRDGDTLKAAGHLYDLARFRRVIVLGAGKAACPMAQAVETVLGDRITGGLVVTKYGHLRPLERVLALEAGHPVPDEAGAAATERILGLADEADEASLLLCLLSGGGSALLVAPVREITLADKQAVTDLLLCSGARIDELNCVRKHLSRVKGGRLAERAFPATVLTLILSDVIGDRLDVIASGPTVPDTTTFRDAVAVLERYGLRDQAPKAVMRFLDAGARGEKPESPRADSACFGKVRNIIVGGPATSLAAARERASDLGYDAEILTGELAGEAREAARFLAVAAQKAAGRDNRPVCLIAGGETTVTVRGTGKGGRNQELALAFALAVEGREGVTLLSAGTDGTDGPTDAAGAIVDGGTASRARAAGLDPRQYLDNNDAYTFFSRLDAMTGSRSHVKTGPTATNVMDMQIILIGRQKRPCV